MLLLADYSATTEKLCDFICSNFYFFRSTEQALRYRNIPLLQDEQTPQCQVGQLGKYRLLLKVG